VKVEVLQIGKKNVNQYNEVSRLFGGEIDEFLPDREYAGFHWGSISQSPAGNGLREGSA
jgi:hypothetical protein